MKPPLSILFLAIATGAGWAAPASKSERPKIPADLFCDLKTVPNDENAIINWRRAAEIEIPLDDKLNDAIRFCWKSGVRTPDADVLSRLESWLRRNHEARELFSASLTKPKAQWPERNPENVQKELFGLALMTKARIFEADRLASEGKFTNAVILLEDSLRLTQLGVEADAALIHYMVSSSTRVLVQSAMVRLASRPQMPVALIERLLKNLPKIESETNTYARILSVEFTIDASHLTDLKKLAETWSKVSETNAVMLLYPEQFRRPFKVLLDPMLVSQHPKPLDEVAGMEHDANRYRIFRTNACAAWTNRITDSETEREEAAEKFLKEIEPLMELVEGEPLPLSKQAAQRARGAYSKIENPVGKLFGCCSLGEILGSDVRVFHARTAREATRAIVALLIFERRKGILPAKLTDLVEEKILDSVPYDPFANASLSYSRDRRIVWSVGADVVDDDGKGDETSPWLGDDAVWQIPEIN